MNSEVAKKLATGVELSPAEAQGAHIFTDASAREMETMPYVVWFRWVFDYIDLFVIWCMFKLYLVVCGFLFAVLKTRCRFRIPSTIVPKMVTLSKRLLLDISYRHKARCVFVRFYKDYCVSHYLLVLHFSKRLIIVFFTIHSTLVNLLHAYAHPSTWREK